VRTLALAARPWTGAPSASEKSAQVIVEGATFVTHDRAFASYLIPTLWDRRFELGERVHAGTCLSRGWR
jgi:hypothetical protein